MSNKFNQFDNTTAPSTSDYEVGYGAVGANPAKEKRWTLSVLKSFWQGILNISLLDRESDNHVEAKGNPSGSNVSVSAAGVDGNIDLLLSGKGTGIVKTSGNVEIPGTLTLSGNLVTSGNDVNTGGGNVNTSGGDVTIGSGSLNLASGLMALSASDIIFSGSGDITLTSLSTLDVNGGSFKTDTIAVSTLGTVTILDPLQADEDVTIGSPISEKDLSVATVSGNASPGPPGGESVVLHISGRTDFDSVLFPRDEIRSDAPILTKKYLKASISIGLTADVGSAQGSGLITKEFNQYATVANPGDAATLPLLTTDGEIAAPLTVYTHIVVRNDGINAMDVFPNTGGTINGGAPNAAISVAAGATATFYGVEDSGVNQWFASIV